MVGEEEAEKVERINKWLMRTEKCERLIGWTWATYNGIIISVVQHPGVLLIY